MDRHLNLLISGRSIFHVLGKVGACSEHLVRVSGRVVTSFTQIVIQVTIWVSGGYCTPSRTGYAEYDISASLNPPFAGVFSYLVSIGKVDVGFPNGDHFSPNSDHSNEHNQSRCTGTCRRPLSGQVFSRSERKSAGTDFRKSTGNKAGSRLPL